MIKSKCLRIVLMSFSIVFMTAATSPIMAAEPGNINYIAGAPGPFLGEFPPIPGVFMVSQTSYITSDALYDNSGDEIDDFDYELNAWIQTFRFVGSYPKKLWGANIYSQLVVPIVLNLESSLSVDTHSPAGMLKLYDDDTSGLSNLTISPLIMNWQEHGSPHYYTLGMDIILKGTSYDSDKDVNSSTGYMSFMPVAAYRYDDPDGLDIGVKANLLFNLKNDDTDYETGNMVAFESLAGWNFGKWKAGVLLNYTQQMEKDKVDGVETADSEYRFMNIGPHITYISGPIIFNVNYQKSVLVENTSNTDSFWVNFTLPLFVPKSAIPKG